MKRAYYLSCMFALSACETPQVTSQRTIDVEGNTLMITASTANDGRAVTVDNTQKRWAGSLAGGKEKWAERKDLLYREARGEIESICGEWFFSLDRGPFYNMMDKDETMGGVAPVLGVAASMAAYAAAYSSTDEANIPVGVYIGFHCRADRE